MKYYVLAGQINGQPIRERIYPTRFDAENSLNRLLLIKNLQVEDDRFPCDHTEEFVCDQYTRFSIRRVKKA